MSKHTPGPWRYQEGSDPYTHIVRAGETGLGRFVVQCGQSRDGIEEANARLIAAAPEMLLALYRILPLIQEHEEEVRLVLDAIAKAEGRQ